MRDVSARQLVRTRRTLAAFALSLSLAITAAGCGKSPIAPPGTGGTGGAAPPPLTDAGTDGGVDRTTTTGVDAPISDGPPAPVDPATSAAWRWQPCGAIPPSTVKATAIAYAPLTEEVAAAYADGRVVLHSVEPDRPDRVLHQQGPATTAIAFSPDGKFLAEAHDTVWVRRLQDGQVVTRTSIAETGCVPERLRISPDGARLLGWNRSAVCVWRMDSGALVAKISEAFTAAALTNQGLVVGRRSATGPLVVESVALPGLARTTIPLAGANNTALLDPSSLVISPSGDTFVADMEAGAPVRMLTLWAVDGTRLLSTPRTLQQMGAYSPDGRLVLLDDKIVNTSTGAIERTVPQPVPLAPVMLNSDGTRLAAWADIADLEVAAVYDARTSGELRVFSALAGVGPARPQLLDMAMSLDGKLLATSDFRNLMVFRVGATFETSVALQSRSRCELPFQIDFSADGAAFVCSGDGWTLTSSLTRAIIETIAPPANVPSDNCGWSMASLSTRDTWLVVGGYGRFLNVRRTATRSAPFSPIATARCNARAAFTADESLMATTGPELYRTSDWTRVWPGAVVETAAQTNSPFGDVQFAPGERELLISSCGDTTPLSADVFSCAYALHSAATGEKIRELPALQGHQAAFSPEGHWIVSGGMMQHLPSGTLRAVQYGAQIARLAIFARNGDIIAAMPDNTLVRYCRDYGAR